MSADLLVEPTVLNAVTENSNSLVVDVTTVESYSKHHIPGAVYFDYRHLVSGIAPSPEHCQAP